MDIGLKRWTAGRRGLLIGISSILILGMDRPSAFTAPVPIGNPAAWVTPGDYPAGGNTTVHQGTVEFALPITSDGTLINCEIILSSGYKELDDQTCKIMLTRAKFHPAMTSSGIEMNGIYRNFLRWGRNPLDVVNDADLALSVNKLPDGNKSYRLVRVDMMLDEHGKVTDCAAEKTTDSTGLESLSCQRAMAAWTSLPPMVVGGVNVPSVQTKFVAFVKAN